MGSYRWRLLLGNIAIMATLLLTACAKAGEPPATLDVCRASITHPEGGHGYIEYHFTIANRSSKTISAVRINFEDPASLKINAIRFSPTRPLGTEDYLHAIVPHSSVAWTWHTDGLPRTRSPLTSTSLPCSVIAVRYEDGHTWSIAPGILAPGEVWNPER